MLIIFQLLQYQVTQEYTMSIHWLYSLKKWPDRFQRILIAARNGGKNLKSFTNTETHTILQPGQTRWLTLHRCIERLLKQHNPLDLYFTNVVMEDATETSQSILITLKDPFTKAYLEFLKQALHEFNKVNALFQSERPLLYDMENKLEC